MTRDKKVKKASAPARRRQLLKNVKKGKGVSSDFFKRHGWLVIFFMVVILVLTGMRYRTKVYMMQIKKLRTELKQAENERIEEKALYMSMIREQDMVELARRYELGLSFPVKPPYVLTLEAADSVAHPKPE